MFHNKGYMKEIEIADGMLTIVCTCNPLEINGNERELMFTLVDMINKFEKDRTENSTQGPAVDDGPAGISV